LVGKQIIREYTYLYGAFCPECFDTAQQPTGENFTLILPYANSQCMGVFLDEFSKQFADYRVIMGMDNASWHGCKLIEETDNIVPLFLPAYAPELNPAENVWHNFREKGDFKNRTFCSIEEVKNQICYAVQTILSNKETVKSIVSYKWIEKALKCIMIAV
jgi:transposase